MKENNHKIRIKDIAKLAGVSEGTVDRVLHQRGDVSEKSRLAVTKVLDEIEYKPNLFARSLASKKQYRFVCLFPQFQVGDYWERVDKGFDLAAKDFMHHNVQIQKYYFDQYDLNSFVNATNLIVNSAPDAVIVAPIFRDETLKFTNQLSLNSVSFSYIDSLVEDTDYLTYYGQNSTLSGYIAAKFLVAKLFNGDSILVVRTQRNGAVSNQTFNRYTGFMNYINECYPENQYNVIEIEFVGDNELANMAVLQAALIENPNLRAAITFNSKVYKLASKLETLGLTNFQIIGYDLLEENINYLKKGVISVLLAQQPEKQAYLAAKDICKKLIFNQEVTNINYMPIDILIKENIEAYIHFSE